ncbi:MAG: hypothetical protein U1E26_00220 [Coriobacteriia bacterium]|nr:hypothetical protein [Coriobacteriia bacterium]
MTDARTGAKEFLRHRPAWVATAVPLGVGVVCVVAWAGLVAGLFGGMTIDDDSGLFLTAGLLGLTTLSAAAAMLSTSRVRFIALGGAIAYAAVFAYLRLAFDRMMPDAVLYAITAVFFVAPAVTGVATVLAAKRSRH